METDINRDTVQAITQAVYEQIIENQQKVADIFISFFGEDRVDYQKPNFTDVKARVRTCLGDPPSNQISKEKIVDDLVNNRTVAGTILVYFPKVTVTNERGDSIEITKLFVNTTITSKGSIYGEFSMTRGEYTAAQWRAGYLHSHCSHIPSEGQFASCCTGTGPIRHTIALLSREFDEDRWNLYCFELSEYVKVESLAGIPYNRMTNVIDNPNNPRVVKLRYNLEKSGSRVKYTTVDSFWRDYIRYNQLPLSFCNGNYSLAIPPIVFFKNITAAYIEYLSNHLKITKEAVIALSPSELISYGLRKGIYIDNTFHDYSNVRRDTSSSAGEGGFVCNFKNKVITRHIISYSSEQDTGSELLLNISAINALLTRTLFIINYGTTKDSHQASKELRII